MPQFKSVLVVEDDHTIRLMIKHIVEAEGYVCFVAEDGEEALKKLAMITPDQRPCLIFTDFTMPKVNGAELIAALQKDDCLASIPVVMVSANHNAPGIAKKLIKKPCTIETIVDTLHEFCK